MKWTGFAVGVLVVVFSAVAVTLCQDTPEIVTVCQLKNDPPAYNHKLVEVTAFVSHAFEDFTLFDPTCSSWPAVWLEYGGKAKSGTMYCCGVTADRQRPEVLVVEKIPIPLTENDHFHEFDKMIQPPFRSGRQGAMVQATLIGRFFSGREIHYRKGTSWGGYGHMGCCSLLAIQEIVSASPQDRDDLDYGASADQPEIGKTGCGYSFLTPIQPANDLIHAQQQADLGQTDWAFDDPQRVASKALARFSQIEEPSITGIKEVRKAQGRIVYKWNPPGKVAAYTVVVSRPFWLSLYSRDSKRVAWVVTAAYVSSCDNTNSVTRIR